MGLLLQTLLAERTSFQSADQHDLAPLHELANRMTQQAVESMGDPASEVKSAQPMAPQPSATMAN